MAGNIRDVPDSLTDSGRSSPMLSRKREINGFQVVEDQKNFRLIQEADTILQTLQQSFVVEELKRSLFRLQDLFQNEYIQKFFEYNQVYLPVISVMKHLEDYTHIQLIGLQLLCQFIATSSSLQENIRNSDAHNLVIKSLHDNTSNPELILYGMKIFSSLLQSEQVCLQLKKERKCLDVLELIVKSVTTFPDHEEIQINSLSSLAYFLHYDDEMNIELLNKYFTCITESLAIHSSHPQIVNQILLVFYRLAQHVEGRNILAKENVHLKVMQFVKSQFHYVVVTSLEVLVELSCVESVQQDMIQSRFIVEVMYPILVSRPNDTDLQIHGLRIFAYTACGLFKEKESTELASEWTRVIYSSMSQQMDNAYIQELCCKALTELLCCKPEAYMWIGDSTELKQDPLHTLCLGALLMHRKDQSVFTAACECFFYLTADNDWLCKNLMEKNSHVAIIEGIKQHIDTARAVAAGCKAIRGLCIFNDENKLIVSEYDDILMLLVKILRMYNQDIGVLGEAISTVACLADNDVIRHQCLVENVHRYLLDIMDEFSEDVIIQEAVIETLAVIGGATSGAEILNRDSTVEKIIRTLLSFQLYINIQKKGIMTLQIIVDNDILQSQDMCSDLTQLIKMIMMTHKNVLSVQREAVVFMQILAEKGKQMSKVLVNQGCHELLFQILEKYIDDKGLHDLASECLYVIGCEQNLKSDMLLVASAKGFYSGVECLLQIGSDVNIGDGQETPLYYAVKNQDENMVKLILEHNVCDILTSLQLSLDKQYDYITGLLLSYIDSDRDHQKSGIVVWNGIGLGDLKPQWFLPLMCGVREGKTTPGVGRKLSTKIKKGEEKRAKRLTRSPSDSYLDIMKHHCWRIPPNNVDMIKHRVSIIKEIREAETLKAKDKRTKSLPKKIKAHLSNIKDSGAKKSPHGSPKISSTSEFNLGQNSTPTLQGESLTTEGIEASLIIPIPDDPFFENSTDEWEEWKKTTLTGAKFPFHPDDPRRQREKKVGGMTAPPVKWQRKFSAKKSGYSPPPGPTNNFQSWGRLSPVSTSSRLSSSMEIVDDRRERSSYNIDETDMETSFDETNDKQNTACLEFTIKSLDVSCNNITTLDLLVEKGEIFLQKFEQVTRLNISNNRLSALPSTLTQYFTQLTCIDLKNNFITTFPIELSSCLQLHTLDLSNNQILDLGVKKPYPELNIKTFKLSSNGLKDFPRYLNKLMPRLEKLRLSKNDLKGALDFPLQLTEIRKLDLSHNDIRSIGDKFFVDCTKLECLQVSNNGLENLPNEAISDSLSRLSTVILYKNRLSTKEPFFIPKFILELPSLRTIDLSDNKLLGLPAPFLWKTQLLKEIFVSKNNITKMNLEGAKSWNKVEKFYISHNKLSELPKEIGLLISLQTFDISHNKLLTTLPDELGKCSKLWEMPHNGCNLDLSDSLLKGRVRDLVVYLHNRLKKAQYYYRMKLMVVGFGGRGKTTLLRALRKKFKHAAEDRPTVGVIVEDWKYERQRFGKNAMYTISTWDFAGQEDFYSTHQCFLSNRAVYLVVYDVTRGISEIDQLQPWLSNILARAPLCPVITVGTHYDKLKPAVSDEVLAEFEERLQYISNKPGFPVISLRAMVDCSKENAEIEELRKRLKDIIDDFKVKGKSVMGQKIPASYVKLSELLSEKGKNCENNLPVLRRNQVIKLVQKAGLDLDEDELPQAINFLHETGVLLHYNESALHLRDFYFINPGWLCRMMAQIVTVPQINPFISPEGIMKKESAKWLFTGKAIDRETKFTFPHHMIPQYLKLLEKFEIALPRNNDELMIPCRLPANKPTLKINVHSIPKIEKIQRVYVMPSAPIGFWSRLITRLVVFSHSSVAEILLQLRGEPIVQYWREGIFVAWPKYAYFLVDCIKNEDEELHITVPSTTYGYRLLGYLVDHVDALVDEWYPGLTGVDPLLGRELLQKFALCHVCQGTPMRFLLSRIIIQSETCDEIFCPQHEGNIPLNHLAPDVMLTDLESHFQLDYNQFNFSKSTENELGDGGFGSVFRALYKNKPVAVKVFNTVGDIHPHKLLRQEVNILQRLNHPNVLSLTAVGLRPDRLIVLELAPLGSLGSILRNNTSLSRLLHLKIATQVCEGMAYLHKLMVVYRDMKPDNVLIYSLSPGAKVNAKISDYGISRFTTLYGLTAQEGTPAYRAPEVIKGETYSFQADVFSFGITVYVMVTGGQHPFDEYEFRSEMDKAFAENLPIPPITKRGCKPWPDMQELINQCLHQVPDYRPQSHEICKRLKSAELYCLKEFRPISVGTTVECITYQPINSHEGKLWIASGDNDIMLFGWLNLLDYKDEYKGTMFPYGRILSMLPIDEQYILLGTQMGKIWVFDALLCKLAHSTEVLPDSVLSLHHFKREKKNDMVFAGLANGSMAFFPLSELLQEPDTLPLPPMVLGLSHEPVRCIVKYKDKTVTSCGTKVVIIGNGMNAEKKFDTSSLEERNRTFSTPILTMALGKYLYISKRQSSVVEIWDIKRSKLRDKCDIKNTFNLQQHQSRITAMVLHDKKELWIGTGGGQIVIVDSLLLSPLVMTARHTASIRCLMCIYLKERDEDCIILSGGLGFRHTPDTDIDRENQYGCIAVWDSNLPQIVKSTYQ